MTATFQLNVKADRQWLPVHEGAKAAGVSVSVSGSGVNLKLFVEYPDGTSLNGEPQHRMLVLITPQNMQQFFGDDFHCVASVSANGVSYRVFVWKKLTPASELLGE